LPVFLTYASINYEYPQKNLEILGNRNLIQILFFSGTRGELFLDPNISPSATYCNDKSNLSKNKSRKRNTRTWYLKSN